MTNPTLKVAPHAEQSLLLATYENSEVANTAKAKRPPARLDKPEIQQPTWWETIHRAFKQFLGLPILMCVVAIFLAVTVSAWDRNPPELLLGVRGWITTHMQTDADQTFSLLELLAGSMFTLTTFTFSLLLIALQQSGGSMGIQVVDGFVSRKRNQAVLGYLLGVVMFVTLTRAIGEPDSNPALGAFLSLILSLISIVLLAALFYMTTNQSRPNFVVDDLRARILHSRRSSHDMLRNTRRVSFLPEMEYDEVICRARGYISQIDFSALSKLISGSEQEVELVCEIGDYMVFGDPVARVRGLGDVADSVRNALSLDSQRSLEHDPTAGLTNLYAMAWRTGSAAQHNQETTVNAINAMSDIFVHWLHDEPLLTEAAGTWAIVYPDTALLQLIDALEHQLVVASGSKQPMPVASIYSLIARTMDRMRPEVLDRISDMVIRSLSTWNAHVLTYQLETAIRQLVQTLRANDRGDVADKVDAALESKIEKLLSL